MHEWAVTVTLSILWDGVLLLLSDDLLVLDRVLLRANMLRLDYTQLLFHLAALLSDHIRRHHVFGPARVHILHSRQLLGSCRKLAVLGHANGVLVERGLKQELAVLNANGWTAIDTVGVLKTGLRSCHSILSS